MSLTAERDSWRKNFEELKVKYEELQDLFVATDDELNEYRDKFVKEAIQHEYVKNDYDYLSEQLYDIKVRLYKLEQR
jgi:predicted  nucleic acid-binding Zn-ribbon protein